SAFVIMSVLLSFAWWHRATRGCSARRPATWRGDVRYPVTSVNGREKEGGLARITWLVRNAYRGVCESTSVDERPSLTGSAWPSHGVRHLVHPGSVATPTPRNGTAAGVPCHPPQRNGREDALIPDPSCGGTLVPRRVRAPGARPGSPIRPAPGPPPGR